MQPLDSDTFDCYFHPEDNGLHSRRVIGLHVSSRAEWMSAALVTCEGQGLQARLRVTAAQNEKIPAEITALYDQIISGKSADPARIAIFQAELADIQTKLVHQIVSDSQCEMDQVLVIAVVDPGIWHTDRHGDRHWLGLCDAARLAEGTGLSVIDGFPARDLAQGGRGGPLTAVPMRMIFGSMLPQPTTAWVVIELSRVIRTTYFSGKLSADSRIFSRSVQPGLDLLNALVLQISSGEQLFDSGGHLAVQGRKIPQLLTAWKSCPQFSDPGEWDPLYETATRFLELTQENQQFASCTLQDILCTASHLVVEGITRAMNEVLPQHPSPATVFLMGGGCRNGFLVNEIAARLPTNLRLCQLTELGLRDESVKSAMSAALGILHVDHVPANIPSISGAQTPRILGRLTPGNPRHWRRLLEEMASNRPQTMTLRHAI